MKNKKIIISLLLFVIISILLSGCSTYKLTLGKYSMESVSENGELVTDDWKDNNITVEFLDKDNLTIINYGNNQNFLYWSYYQDNIIWLSTNKNRSDLIDGNFYAYFGDLYYLSKDKIMFKYVGTYPNVSTKLTRIIILKLDKE